MTEIVLPQHANALGTVFGGQVLAWIDICGAVAAHRHCGTVAVTAAVDGVSFLAPIHVGDVVCLHGHVNAAFRTSLEVEVVVDVEDPATMKRSRCLEALLTFVAIGADGKPRPVPPVEVTTPDEVERHKAAVDRREARLKSRR
jgi:acyl-CoA hydrolase